MFSKTIKTLTLPAAIVFCTVSFLYSFPETDEPNLKSEADQMASEAGAPFDEGAGNSQSALPVPAKGGDPDWDTSPEVMIPYDPSFHNPPPGEREKLKDYQFRMTRRPELQDDMDAARQKVDDTYITISDLDRAARGTAVAAAAPGAAGLAFGITGAFLGSATLLGVAAILGGVFAILLGTSALCAYSMYTNEKDNQNNKVGRALVEENFYANEAHIGELEKELGITP